MIRALVAIAASCLILLEGLFMVNAARARATAHQMLQLVDKFRLGQTSKEEAVSAFRKLGINPRDEGCSAAIGTCEGIYVDINNCLPRPDSFSLFHVLVCEVSIFRPTDLIGNFYFNSDRLESGSVAFATDKASVGTAFAAATYDEDAKESWETNHRTGSGGYFQVVARARQPETSLKSADNFNLGCLESIQGCNTELRLWPSVAGYKSK